MTASPFPVAAVAASAGPQKRKGAQIFRALALFFFFVAGLDPLVAGEAVPRAPDAATEKRMLAISSELRCLVCQNESLAASHAELAVDLRREIRTQIKAGRTDGEILDFMVSRYGDFVRYRPPLKASTWLLWFGPVLLLAGALIGLFSALRRRNAAKPEAPLSAEENREAERLLGRGAPRS